MDPLRPGERAIFTGKRIEIHREGCPAIPRRAAHEAAEDVDEETARHAIEEQGYPLKRCECCTKGSNMAFLGAGFDEIDEAAAEELDLYADNTSELYQQKLSIIENVKRKIRSGKYDPALAPKLWLYWYDAAARMYTKEHGTGNTQQLFPKALRMKLAEERARTEYQLIVQGEYGPVGPAHGPSHLRPLKGYEGAPRKGWVNLYCALLDEGTNLYGATTDPQGRDPHYWANLRFEGTPFEIWETSVPAKDAAQFEAQGTSEQEFSDGYEAMNALNEINSIGYTVWQDPGRSEEDEDPEDYDGYAGEGLDARVRFNSGYHDGAHDAVQGRPMRNVSRHFDKLYAQGYELGYEDGNSGAYTGDSSKAWKERASVRRASWMPKRKKLDGLGGADDDEDDEDIEEMLQSYIETALWSSTDESDESGGEPLDANYGPSDIAPETRKTMKAECADFIDYLIRIHVTGWEKKLSYADMGHNFWLTRNRHGAGFWDLGLGKLGDQLTDAAHTFGSVDLYVGDDGKIHQQ